MDRPKWWGAFFLGGLYLYHRKHLCIVHLKYSSCSNWPRVYLFPLLNKYQLRPLEFPGVSQIPVLCTPETAQVFLGHTGLSFKVSLSLWCKGKNIYSSPLGMVVVAWEITACLSPKITSSNILFLSLASDTLTLLMKSNYVLSEQLLFKGLWACYDYDSWSGSGSSWHYNLPNDHIHKNKICVSGRVFMEDKAETNK